MTKPNKLLSLILLLLSVISCSNKSDSNFTLTGSIKGLKKGVVYLQKDGDSSIINLDSMQIIGEPNFTLQTDLEEPLLLYLKLFKNDGEEHYIPFFADKGVTEINTSLKNFSYDAEVKGSKQQDLLNEYSAMMSRFNDQNLDLTEAKFFAFKENDSTALDSIVKATNTLIKRKYSYTIQFAINNKDSEISPYLALYEMPNANPMYVDSIYSSLNASIKKSYYGKKLKDYIESRTK